SAFLLGELSAEEAAEIERAAAADPAIRMSLAELEKTSAFLGGVFSGDSAEGLLPNQREAVLRASRDADSLGKVIELESAKRSWRPWLAGIGAAAAVAIAAFLMNRVEPGGNQRLVEGLDGVSEEIALLPLPGPTVDGASTSVGSGSAPAEAMVRSMEAGPGEYLEKVARHVERSPLPAREVLPPTGKLGAFSSAETTRLPVLVGSSSYRWVSAWIRERGELPPRNAVRIEELVNLASLPVNQGGEDLEVSLEVVDCPWNESSVVVGVQLFARGGSVSDLTAVAKGLGAHRILGSFSHRDNGSLPTVLPQGRRTLVLIECLRGNLGAEGGNPEIQVQVGVQPARRLAVGLASRQGSAGMNHAVTLAGFGMWLRGEGVTATNLRGMLEISVDDPDSVRADRRRVISEALKLAESER
ncbi:MAG: von Willebrand factor type A domain-containing protein, partial [Verrucomicrobiota bacterium]